MRTAVPDACTEADSWLCEKVYDWTGNETASGVALWLIGKPAAIVGIFLAAVAIRWLAVRAIERLAVRAEDAVIPGHSSERSGPSRRSQRARSLASLLKSITTGVVFGVAFVMALSVLGLNVAPILASAGVLGLAVGFGAQSLVKDFLAGIAMMIEDQYGVGDAVDLGEASGTVEAVGLRVTRVRDVEGTVWYVRNGEILRVGNQSQNWARTVLDVGVAPTEDLSRVREVLAEVAGELWQDPKFRGVVIEEPEVWGVESITPDAVLMRVTIKTAPLEQWRVARELRERIKRRFDAEGIAMPLPSRVVWDHHESS